MRLARPVGVSVMALGALLVGMPAQAVLGGSAATIAADQSRMKGSRKAALAPVQVGELHEITLADGSTIREYVNGAGVVFAVSWSTRLKPRLGPLLGEHAGIYAAAARAAAAGAGIRRKTILEAGDLVLHSTAHLNSYVGVAYLRSLVPDGVQAHALR